MTRQDLIAAAVGQPGVEAARVVIAALAAITIALAVRLARRIPALVPYALFSAAVMVPSVLAAFSDPPAWTWSLLGLGIAIVAAFTVTVVSLVAAARRAAPAQVRPPRLNHTASARR